MTSWFQFVTDTKPGLIPVVGKLELLNVTPTGPLALMVHEKDFSFVEFGKLEVSKHPVLSLSTALGECWQPKCSQRKNLNIMV